jgi:hypothetical protein
MPDIILNLPEAVSSVSTSWQQANYYLKVELHSNEVVITSDANGLRNLAIQLLSLASDEAFSGCHLRLDGGQMLVGESKDLIIQRI